MLIIPSYILFQRGGGIIDFFSGMVRKQPASFEKREKGQQDIDY